MKETIGGFLKEHGIKPSYQRIRIYEYLMEACDHPTVDAIYHALNHEIPTLSKTTVYNTLKTFVEKGIAMAIPIDDSEVRYDSVMELHGHFKCVRCGAVYDFPVTPDLEAGNELDGFTVTARQIFFYGECKKCKGES